MSRVRVGKHHAIFPPDYSERVAPKLIRVVGNRSRRLRAFLFDLPPSRFRTALFARYFREGMEAIAAGEVADFLRAVDTNAELQLFDIGTYRGPDGWAQALEDWLSSFGTDYVYEEYLNPSGSRVALITQFNGAGAGSGLPLAQRFGFVIDVEDGMAIRGCFYRTRAEALEALGLRE